MIPLGQAIEDVELDRPDGSKASLHAELDRYLVIQVLRYYG